MKVDKVDRVKGFKSFKKAAKMIWYKKVSKKKNPNYLIHVKRVKIELNN